MDIINRLEKRVTELETELQHVQEQLDLNKTIHEEMLNVIRTMYNSIKHPSCEEL